MRIVSVDAWELRGTPESNATYWGKQVWSDEVRYQQNRYPLAWRLQASYSQTINTVIVRIEASDGSVGYGEAKAPVASKASKTIIDELLAELLIGQDPLQVDVLWERMFAQMRVRGHQQGFMLEAMSAVDIALWDLMGKSLGVPVYKLLGGAYRTKIPVYASSVPAAQDHSDQEGQEQCLRMVESYLSKGFKAMKLGLGSTVENDLKNVGLIRGFAGEDTVLFADAGWKYDLTQAKSLAKGLAELGVQFLEAPLAPENVQGYSQLCCSTQIAIAGGEWLGSRYSLLPYLKARAFDILQPDVCRAGGITETHRMAQLADLVEVPVALHVSIGSAIHFAATAQLAAAIPNLYYMELWAGDNPLGNSILSYDLPIRNGFYELDEAPGLGISINEDALRRYII
jgi:D-galactarolactone cycloisomerase